MVDDELIIIGLPSSGLHKLTGSLDIRQIEDADIRRAYETPDEPCDFTPEGMIGRWTRCINEYESRKGLLIYPTPWGLLERQLRRITPDAHAQLESVARNILSFWHNYHLALYGLRRQHAGQFLLINGERPIEIHAVVALLEKQFALRPSLKQTFRPSVGIYAADDLEDVLCQLVDALAPECTELYTELESCAELMGRQPEFDFGDLARRNAFFSDLLRLTARQSTIEHLLDQHGIEAGDVESRLEFALRTRKQLVDSDPEKRQRLSGLEGKLNTLQMEAERLVLQVRQLEEKLKSKQVEGDGHLARILQLEEKLADGDVQARSLNTENELYLLQLHHVQEELAHHFELNQQQEKQLAELKRQLQARTVPLASKIARSAVDLKNSVASFIASSARSAAGLPWWNRKEQRIRRKQLQAIRASGLFDEKWYLQNYPDVAQAGCDPIEHYLRFGASEARNPSARFDTQWYLDTYKDVTDARVNPLLHYIEFGKSEGRQPMRFVA